MLICLISGMYVRVLVVSALSVVSTRITMVSGSLQLPPLYVFHALICTAKKKAMKGVKGELGEEKEIERTYKGKARRYENGSGKEESWGYL